MGQSVVKAALSHGDIVTAVGRTFEDTLGSMKNLFPPNPKLPPANYLGLLCDVRARETVEDVFKQSIDHWGHIDIVANCSGYGVIGACEDQDEYDIRNQFETNFFGTLNIIQLSLGHFRTKPNGEGGRYLIFSSTSGALGVPGLGPYCATKYAVEGLIESMLYEVDHFNIKATLVEPGHVRRDEPDSPLPTFGHFFIKPASEPYTGPTAPAAHAKRMVQWLGDKQPTSAVKSAELVWQLGHCSFPPLRLLLGTYAVESVRDRLRTITEEIEDWKHLSFGTSGASGEGSGAKKDGSEKNIKEEDRDEDDRDEEDGGDEDRGDEDQEDDDDRGDENRDEDEEMHEVDDEDEEGDYHEDEGHS